MIDLLARIFSIMLLFILSVHYTLHWVRPILDRDLIDGIFAAAFLMLAFLLGCRAVVRFPPLKDRSETSDSPTDDSET